MRPPSPKSILPFVPARDFEMSTRFYRALGFEGSDADGVRAMKLGACGFLLQDFFVEEWANNFMMAMYVDDAAAWHRFIADNRIVETFTGTRCTEPALQDWGMVVMHLFDPSGVLWHISQDPAP